jgi:hypothetical protein
MSPRVTQQRTRQMLLVLGNPLDPDLLPEQLELFDVDGNPIDLSGISDLPADGLTGQILAKVSSESYDVAWIVPPEGGGAPEGGTTGQILAKLSSTDFDTDWVDPPEDGAVLVFEQLDEPDTDVVGSIWIRQEPV